MPLMSRLQLKAERLSDRLKNIFKEQIGISTSSKKPQLFQQRVSKQHLKSQKNISAILMAALRR